MPANVAALDAGTKLAVDRTWLARERTLLAWVRTAASLITFGFTIYKFFQLELGNRLHPGGLIGPREFAILLIALGIGSLVVAFIEHRLSAKTMRAAYGDVIPASTAGLVAGVVAALGVLAIVLVVFRL